VETFAVAVLLSFSFSKVELGSKRPGIMGTKRFIRSVLIVLVGCVLAHNVNAQAPKLSIAASGDGSFVLSWPGNASNYVLESATKLEAVTAWQRVAGPPTLTNASLQLVITPKESVQFFRLSIGMAPLPSENFVIDGYTLVSSAKISPTVSEDTYAAKISNWSDSDARVTASLTGIGANIIVLEGTLDFGEVPIGATRGSVGTFKVRHDPSQPLDKTVLDWTIVAIPLPPTSFALIEKALADGIINAETALLYKVYVEFNDDQLPAQYQGREDGFFEARAVMAAAEQFDTLSPTTQQLIAPFLREPNAPGSWYAERAAQHTSAMRPLLSVGASPAIDWTSVDTLNNKVQVWWDGVHVQDGLDAIRIATEINDVIWPKLTKLLGEPLPDTNHIFYGPDAVIIPNIKDDDRLDIFLTDSARVYTAVRKECTGGVSPAFINLGVSRSFYHVVHELTHAILYRYPLKTKCDNRDYQWLHDATAEWAKHYVYPTTDGTYRNHEHNVAPYFLGYPERSLNYEEPGGPARFQHPYGAYLWFLYLTRGVDGGAHYVRQTWDAVATHDSLGAIQQGVGSVEAFRGEWAQFVLYNWNRIEGKNTPYRYYFQWDALEDMAKEKVTEAPSLKGKASNTYPLVYEIPCLAAQYFHYDFTGDRTIRSLTFTHPYADGSEPAAKVQAILKIRDQDWKPAEDWTRFGSKTLCFDKPTEDVEELVIVISNSEFIDRTRSLRGYDVLGSSLTELKVSANGCNPFIGTIDFSRTIDQTPNADNQFNGTKITETATTTVSFELAVVQGLNESVYVATNVNATWQHTGSTSLGDTQCSGARSGAAGPGPTDSNELIFIPLPPPLGDGKTLYYQGLGHIDPNNAGMSIPYTCTGQGFFDVTFGNGASFDWWKTRALSIDPASMEAATTDPDGSLVLLGDFMEEEGDLSGGRTVTKWHWNLKQARRPQ
jgi:hypothetical protein